MRPENIDHNLHISPPRSNEPPITPTSNRQIQFQQAPTPLMAAIINPTHSQTHQQPTTWYMILRLSFDTSQNVTRFQLTTLDGVHVILEPVPEIPRRAMLNETWTQREYELINEPNRQVIPRGIWLNESWTQRQHQIPEQVQNHVAEFYRQLSSAPTYPMSRNQNTLVARSASNSMPVVNQTLQLFTPVTSGEANSSTYESQIQMGGATASPSMNPDEEIDLELRLGRSQ
ncbi:hypothetical protein VNO80_20777 [Phaseolus coccineus]|uniref:Uncharacterized protein n=1 Tax=Phaseolus coccineus TaxID=3886 RepID=A0AAN9QSG0_PHACN